MEDAQTRFGRGRHEWQKETLVSAVHQILAKRESRDSARVWGAARQSLSREGGPISMPYPSVAKAAQLTSHLSYRMAVVGGSKHRSCICWLELRYNTTLKEALAVMWCGALRKDVFRNRLSKTHILCRPRLSCIPALQLPENRPLSAILRGSAPHRNFAKNFLLRSCRLRPIVPHPALPSLLLLQLRLIEERE